MTLTATCPPKRAARRRIVVLAIAVCAVTLVAAKGVPSKVTYIPHDTANKTMEKGGQIINENGLIVLAQRRGAGEVEVHENTNHVFIIVEGEATFITGGTLVNPKNTAPGQIRAERVQGGQTYHLTKGDVITIPANTPHWFKEVPTKTIAYYGVNLEP
jgi:mannose-6-phosphate isomerase-like protein (cupin superfamily)